MLRELLDYLLRSLVDHPQDVEVDCVETAEVTLFYVWARKGDLGRILGKRGQTVEDIRKVMGAAARRQGREVIIDVAERSQRRPEGGRAPASR